MRAGLSTIQQTLTPEASSILNLSITEARRRNHGQTTPLHVAATLLSSPSNFLRQACIRSHPNSSHPLQCRALELCFSVALERIPTTAQPTVSDPPISNALMAALKRAQAHQRRGCPEQQQQPLLAVKVELEQLVISILDDPSVSRVMREASFSSPAVKATIEQSLSNSEPGNGLIRPVGSLPINNRNLYLNPRLQKGIDNLGQLGKEGSSEEIKRVMDILMRVKKRNPVLVGDSEPGCVMRELMLRIEKGEGFGEGEFKNVEVIQVPKKVKELGGLIEARIGRSNIIVDLGDLKWLVEGGSGGDTGREAVVEMAEVVARFGGGGGKVWLVGTATCETYLRCQVYFPSMENDWDLQAVPIASKSPVPGMFPRLGVNGILSGSVGSLAPLNNFPTATTPLLRHVSENSAPNRKISCCPQCTESYEQELAKLVAKEYEKSSSDVKSEPVQPLLPQWLKNAKILNADTRSSLDRSQTKDQEMVFKQKSQDLQRKWSDTCFRLHANFHHILSCEKTAPIRLPMTGLYNPNLVVRPQCRPKLQQTRNLGEVLQLNNNPEANQTLEKPCSRPRSPVGTDLVLGRTKISESAPEDRVKDLLGCISFEPQQNQVTKFANEVDADLFKKLLKGLTGRVWWQREAASQVASAVTNAKFGNGKRRGTGSKGDIWLLFVGPDRVGKKKMASVLSEQICDNHPITICLGSRHNDEESNVNFRGKTAIDRIAEAVRRNPVSVILLEDIDQADMLIRRSIKWAMERGRLVDSHGREINLGNIIFVLTAKGSSGNPDNLDSSSVLDEKKLASVASGNWQLRLSVSEKRAKRRADWLHSEDRATKPRKEIGSGLSLDLNLAADCEDYRTDGSLNLSDLSVEHEAEQGGFENRLFSISSVPHELIDSVNDAIIFKNLEMAPLRREIKSAIVEKFSVVVDGKGSIELEDEALEKILGGLWLGRTGLEEWVEKVLVPSFRQLKAQLTFNDTVDVRLESDCDSGSRSTEEWLPSRISVKVDGDMMECEKRGEASAIC